MLSPGQRTRVNLVKIAFNKINVLVLDEITNHLDKEALDLIYELVKSYAGNINPKQPRSSHYIHF